MMIEYNGIKFDKYRFCLKTQNIYGPHNKPLKPIVHKTYRQITLIDKCVPVQINYDKLIEHLLVKANKE